jgi:hypothetical protein
MGIEKGKLRGGVTTLVFRKFKKVGQKSGFGVV